MENVTFQINYADMEARAMADLLAKARKKGLNIFTLHDEVIMDEETLEKLLNMIKEE